MLDALKRSNFVIKTVNSSYGHFMYDNEKYFFKIVDKNDFIKEINGYLEVCDKLKVKKLVNILTDNEKYYLIYEYEKTIIKNKGLIHDLFVYYEYYNISYDKNIFINLINNFRRRYRNLKILSYSKNDEFFDVEKITKKWLENNSITYDKLLINKKNKEEYISSVNCKIFVDDSIENCEKVKMLEKNIKVYLINTSYNKFEKKPGIIRVNNLEELYEDIKKNFDNYHY